MLPPNVLGQAVVGGSLSATTGTWAGSPSGFEYQWLACEPDGYQCNEFEDAGDSTFEPPAGAAGWRIAVRVVARHPTDPALDAIAYSLKTAPVPEPPGGGGGGGGTQPADLELSKTASVQTAAVGDTILYRLRVRVKNSQQTSGASQVWS